MPYFPLAIFLPYIIIPNNKLISILKMYNALLTTKVHITYVYQYSKITSTNIQVSIKTII